MKNLGSEYMEKKEKLKLREVASAINAFDNYTAARSYGNTVFNLCHVIEKLPLADKQAIANDVDRRVKLLLEQARKKLEELNIDPGQNPRPEEYRLNGKRNTNEGPG